MILYNTLMGVCAGLALILVPLLGRKLYRKEKVTIEGWSMSFAVLGLILTFLSAHMAITWPLTVNPPINILFSEPCLVLGVLLLATSFMLWKQKDSLADLGSGKAAADVAEAKLTRSLIPLSWVVFGLGLVLLFCTAAIFRFGFIGAAPPQEPISGLLSDYPALENSFFGILYGLSAIGALLAPFALKKHGAYWSVMSHAWIAAGIVFLLFSALNYYTHIGLLVNTLKDTNYRW